ncbi:MAG: Cell division protein ftsA [Microgenomates group bacterium GW2011_GWC1_44_37]|uniref:Cell division protein FtsA n=1 Tax=Candidatus Collierbacteria bacterium GW2011_GWB2_44_22 TaxID=1618387 RepID=A0A0G1HY87_9BACT|nr:MAG: Cell division protein ftsA [Candidatus Collierbacteria bacterium GW2011_GWA2_44_13]KKT51115.1 MAG: Cell division protein ftsA [Candidatus Collierbacteria bacterium GW2011_GWB1_44_197]KKT51578.1 MAG: Cell division protein ftsA [Candidatus Collierbacteria bacterium GW2011_GWB2_44_22]KKT63030.1 MAG: Cell division protein ftsA [Candidatus Collierbacteria bacterium GW2011_GWD1_44_27]KKT65841.1 MAG: Cell division protein ftsA [Candidatus Collierbacteria bacterium GW2011_GWC2_44_30]KKT68585.1
MPTQDSSKINVVGVATVPSKGVRKGQIVNIEECVSAITDCVESAERMAGVGVDSAYISISGEQIASQNSHGLVAIREAEEEISPDDVFRVIEAARAVSLPTSREIIHVLPIEFIVDSQRGIKDPTGMSGVRLETEAHLITGLSPAIKNVTRCVNELGADVSGLVFSGLASAEAVLSETDKELGVILVDIGGGTTSICIFLEGSCVYSAVLPIGAKKITDDIAIGLQISVDGAEKIKHFVSRQKHERGEEEQKIVDEIDLLKLGISEDVKKVSRKTISEGIIRPRLNEIFSMVSNIIKQSGYEGQTPAGVVLTGGGSLTVNCTESCRRVMQLPAKIGTPEGLSGMIEEISTPISAVVVGLVLYGYKRKNEATSGGVKLSGMIKAIPGKQVVGRVVEFIKSFLP